jgi:hypothetical protein
MLAITPLTSRQSKVVRLNANNRRASMPDKLRLALAAILTVVAVVSAVDAASAWPMNVWEYRAQDPDGLVRHWLSPFLM